MSKLKGKKKKKGKPAFHTCTAGEDVHFLSNGPSCQTRGCVCPMPDSLGTARGLSRFSCPKAQLQNCNTTTTVSCTNSFRLNKPKSLDSHSSRGRRKKKKREKSNVLLKPSKAQMPITQPHRLWHKACIVHVGCRLSWECL